jgi:hypothetical protein
MDRDAILRSADGDEHVLIPEKSLGVPWSWVTVDHPHHGDRQVSWWNRYDDSDVYQFAGAAKRSEEHWRLWRWADGRLRDSPEPPR